jgi:hypothetical protein
VRSKSNRTQNFCISLQGDSFSVGVSALGENQKVFVQDGNPIAKPEQPGLSL